MRIIIPPPIVTAAFGVLMYVSHLWVPIRIDSEIIIYGGYFCLGLAVLILSISCLQFIQNKTTVNPIQPEKATVLVVKGMYRFSRNPMYLAMALVLTAIAMYLQNPVTLLGVIGFVWYININQIRIEERAMNELFGSDYAEYCKQVRRWI